MICKVEGCDKPVYAKGACNMHWQRQRRHGSFDDGRVRLLTLDGETKTVSQWARDRGMSIKTLHDRLFRGWSVRKALTSKVQIKSKPYRGVVPNFLGAFPDPRSGFVQNRAKLRILCRIVKTGGK
jgi:hypothetical protein